MLSPEQEFTKKLSEARLKYLSTLPEKMSELTVVWNQLNTTWNNEVKQKMQHLAHNLAGSGGTFGLPLLSEKARSLEQALVSLEVKANENPTLQQMQSIANSLEELRKVELSTIEKNVALPMVSHKTDSIYILDADKDAALGLSRLMISYGCKTKVINDVTQLEAGLRNATPLVILLDADFADIKIGERNVIQTLRKDWVLTCPIIYISKQDDFFRRISAIKATANAYFTKPLDVPLVIERIQILTNAGIVEPYRVLLVEDDLDLANYHAIVMERGGIKVFIETKPELALSRILELNPELVVMDLYMPNYNGIDLIKVIRQHQSLFALPIILLTAEKDINVQFLAREVGVDDFLSKPITEMHLFDSVLSKVQRARYMNLSMTKDSLTGLYVHKKINEFLDLHIDACKNLSQNLCYIILDIDKFKHVNDTYGHLIGDNVLVCFANLLKTCCRPNDFVGRYGGEEFVIIAPDMDEDSAFEMVVKLRKEFTALDHYADDKVFKVSFSAGIASFPKYSEVNSIMVAADKALYVSKNNGRNQSTIA